MNPVTLDKVHEDEIYPETMKHKIIHEKSFFLFIFLPVYGEKSNFAVPNKSLELTKF